MRRVTWNDVKVGDIVYIDNYESGLYPKASPIISGPYTVHHVNDRRLRTMHRRFTAPFCHASHNLILEEYPCLTRKPS